MSVAMEIERVTDPAEIDRRYRHYRPRILFWSILGYLMFYFVRKNIPVAMPVMQAKLGITKESLGLFLTLHGLIYGVSKFANGVVGDRVNARYLMALGLFLSAIANICFGLSTAVITLGVFWMINGWFQGMGFPPCARLMTHWFEPKELTTKMAIWNTSHGIGAAGVLILCGLLVAFFHDWRVCFFVPAAMAIATSGLVLIYLRDTPASVGLPELHGTRVPTHGYQVSGIGSDSSIPDTRNPIPASLAPATKRPTAADVRKVIYHRVLTNRYIWLLSAANFFVYPIRYAVLDWAPTMLTEFKGVSLSHGAFMVAGFEIAGTIGALCTGRLTDKYFGGRGARMSVFCMILCAGAIAIFWKIPAGHLLLSTTVLMLAGFLIYGPQALVGSATANLATKEAAATAIGVNGIFGYASGVLSGWGMGKIAQNYGWNPVFIVLLGAAAMGTLMFALAWPAPRDGYGTAP